MVELLFNSAFDAPRLFGLQVGIASEVRIGTERFDKIGLSDPEPEIGLGSGHSEPAAGVPSAKHVGNGYSGNSGKSIAAIVFKANPAGN